MEHDKFITKCGSKGDGDGDFDFPTSVATDSSGNVFVADMSNDLSKSLLRLIKLRQSLKRA